MIGDLFGRRKKSPEIFRYRYETHMHTSEGSRCARQNGRAMAEAYYEEGYDGIFVTDHAWGGNTAVDRTLPWKEWVKRFALGYEHAKEWGDRNGLKVWFGYESGYQGTDFLIYGITPEWLGNHPELHDASIPEQMDIIHAGGGIVVQAHPFREEAHIPEVRVFPEYVDAIEGINAMHSNPMNAESYRPDWNEKAIALAKQFGKPITAGSDAHSINLTGGGIVTRTPINKPDDLIRLLKSNEIYLLTDGEAIYDRCGTFQAPSEDGLSQV